LLVYFPDGGHDVCLLPTSPLSACDIIGSLCVLQFLIHSTFGFVLFQRRRVILTPEQASEFYAEHFGKPFFPGLIAYMSSGPIIALMLAREKAVTSWRELIGPTNAIKARATHPNRQVFSHSQCGKYFQKGSKLLFSCCCNGLIYLLLKVLQTQDLHNIYVMYQ